MIATGIAFAMLLLLAMAPGLVLCGPGRRDLPALAAIAAASLVVCMLATALLGVAVQLLIGRGIPALALAPVSLALLAGSALRTRALRLPRAQVEWPAIAAALLFVGSGLLTQLMAFGHGPDGSLLVHAWYNADWFKHVAHVNGIADFGLPARDIFANAAPLHYYWLSYVLPGAATELGGDAWTAITLANLFYAALVPLTFYGLVRATGASPWLSALVVILATVVTGRIEIWLYLLRPGGLAMLLGSPTAPPEPALASLALYIPQHALALALLLGWAVIALAREAESARARILALSGLAAVLTISTLFGAMLLGIYGTVELVRRRLAAVAELAAMAAGSILLVVALGVFKLSDPTSAVADRVDGATGGPAPAMLEVALNAGHSLASALGLTLLVALFALMALKPATSAQRNLRLLCISLIVVPFLFLPAVAVLAGSNIAYEVYLRGLNPPAVAFGIMGGWALGAAMAGTIRWRALTVALCAMLVVIGLPAAMLRQLWHGQIGDSFTTRVPADDLAVLKAIKARTPRDIIVWQYPENHFLADVPGRDSWVPIFAGRAVLASSRATDQPASLPDLQLTRDFFAGRSTGIPERVGAVYLSRALTPTRFESLVDEMERKPGWRKGYCPAGACFFARVSANGTK